MPHAFLLFFFFQAEDGIRDGHVTGVQTCALPISTDVRFLAERKLRPLGVFALPDGTTAELEKRPPIMALRCRKPLLPERVVNAGGRLFTWLHQPILVVEV